MRLLIKEYGSYFRVWQGVWCNDTYILPATVEPQPLLTSARNIEMITYICISVDYRNVKIIRGECSCKNLCTLNYGQLYSEVALYDVCVSNHISISSRKFFLACVRACFRFLKNLQIIVSTVLQSIPALGSIVILISLVLCIHTHTHEYDNILNIPYSTQNVMLNKSLDCVDIFAIIGRGLYGEVDPDRFGNLGRACFTLFQLITLDDWFFMYSTIRDEHPGTCTCTCMYWAYRLWCATHDYKISPLYAEHRHILLYLVLFIILETFIFIK